jgi:tetratricopeptide (TPR) repeat protein
MTSYALIWFRSARILLKFGVVTLLLVGCGEARDGDVVLRGDQAFGRGDIDEALAEYRLALRRGLRSPEVLARTAHAYAELGRLSEAREHYMEAASLDPAMAEFAAADFMALAKRAAARQDGITAAAAMEAATELKPGVSIAGLALPLARHFAQDGRYEESLPLYRRAVREGGPPDLISNVTYEMALAYDQIGDCRSAMVYFSEVRQRLSATQREDADWRAGSCAIELAQEANAARDLDGALRFYREMLAVGQPAARIGETWMAIGEVYAARGDCAAATDAMQTALNQGDATGTRPSRWYRRFDDLRARC